MAEKIEKFAMLYSLNLNLIGTKFEDLSDEVKENNSKFNKKERFFCGSNY